MDTKAAHESNFFQNEPNPYLWDESVQTFQLNQTLLDILVAKILEFVLVEIFPIDVQPPLTGMNS